MTRLLLIRHGATKGNAEGRYVGTTDEPLLAESREVLKSVRESIWRKGWTDDEGEESLNSEGEEWPSSEDKGRPNSEDEERPKSEGTSETAEWKNFMVYISPLRRCRESASILFPDKPPICVEDFRECGFGRFEYKNYKELTGDPAYQHFIDSFGESAFPGGETKSAFSKRVCEAFLALEIRSDAALVVHGGTIMALLDHFASPHRGFYDWQLSCGQWYSADWDGSTLRNCCLHGTDGKQLQNSGLSGPDGKGGGRE